MEKQRFEHKVVYCFSGDEENKLKIIEKDGWELITIISVDQIGGLNLKMFLKRPVYENKNDVLDRIFSEE